MSYLNRFDATRQSLRKALLRRVELELAGGGEEPAAEQQEEVMVWVEQLLDRYEASQLISDARFAESACRSLRQRGLGERSIELRLRQKGVDLETAKLALATVDRGAGVEEPELAAALRLVRRRRMGGYRPKLDDPEEAQKRRRRELAALARQGFSYELACKALDQSEEGDDAVATSWD